MPAHWMRAAFAELGAASATSRAARAQVAIRPPKRSGRGEPGADTASILIGSPPLALLVPFIAIGRTLLYFDLQVKAEEERATRWRERLPRRERAATVEA